MKTENVLLLLPSYFTPWTPPLGISILKTYIERRGHRVRCFDCNTVPELWGMHHRYFAKLRELEGVAVNDGYSKLWYVLNAHLLAFVNGASAATCKEILRTVAPLYAIRTSERVLDELVPIVEQYFADVRAVLDGLDLASYTLVGTSTYTTSLSTSLFILREVKRRSPGTRTVMGGGIFADDLAIGSENLDTLLEHYPFIDHVVLGEGELLFGKLVDGELADRRMISIADIEGKTLEIAEVPVPDFSDFDLSSYYHLTIEGGRSCPFQCSFCSETTQWGAYRVKARDLLASQLETLARRYGNNTFFMGDSLMNPYILGFSKELIARGIDVRYDGYLRADKMAADWERARIWERSGVYRVRLGIESGSAAVLDSMSKLTTPEVIARALKALANAGIRTTTYWIVGFPGETEQNFLETLDFIRENHRSIYELEAHPYYYYPYGQVGSRFQTCYSLYPKAVTDVIKFKIWDIVDGRPSRQEKYERLRRLSAVASELGLPNIYTMPDRYYAEERWQRLHPSAREVYEATHLKRRLAAPPAEPVAWPTSSASSPILAYRVDVDEALDGPALAAALAGLVEHNEPLAADLTAAGLKAAASDQAPEIHHVEADPDDATALARVALDLAKRLLPRRGRSVAAARVHAEGKAQALLLLVHPAVADSKSLVYLVEDFFRLFRQQGEGKPIALLGAPDLAATAGGLAPAGAACALYDGLGVFPRIRQATAAPPAEASRLFSPAVWESGLKPAEILALAGQELAADHGWGCDLLIDRRSAGSGLDRAVGPFAAVARSEPLSAASPRVWKERLRALPPAAWPAATGRILVNLEHFVEEPWVENDVWRPRGFVVPARTARPPYALEILPLLDGRRLELRLLGAAPAPAGWDPAALAAELAARVERLLDRVEAWAAARRYCREELAAGLAVPLLIPEAAGEPGAWRTLDLEDDGRGDALERLVRATGAPASAVLLGVWSVLLSRLAGGEDIALLAALDDAGAPCPLRLRPDWETSFTDWVRAVDAKVAARRALAADAGEILASERLVGPEGAPPPSFESAVRMAADLAADGAALPGGPVLWLDAAAGSPVAPLHARLHYRAAAASLAQALAGYWQPFLDAAAGDPAAPLGEILGDGGQAASPVRDLAAEMFAF